MTKYQLASFIALIGLLLASAICHAQQTSYDFVITGARIVDGTGAPWFIGDIGIVGDHIAAIGDLKHAAAKQRIDAKGLVAAPGFIDVQGQSEFNVLVDNRAASKITQGVTTEITGEGTSIAPLTIGYCRTFKTVQKNMAWRWIGDRLTNISDAMIAHGLQ